MGLDITAYSKITPEPHELDGGSWCNYGEEGLEAPVEGRHLQPHVYTSHAESGRGLSLETEINLRGTQYLIGPCVRATGERVRFRAGSYTGYGDWRHALCLAALGCPPLAVWNDPERYRGEPFYELIHFADNEGCIGPLAARDLADDFAWGGEDVRRALELRSTYSGAIYDDFAKAFDLAADTGVVIFH